MDDPYRMLQVGVDADIEEVKDAYWELATPHHLVLAAADAGRRRTGDDAEVAEARSALTRLDAAYAVLADPATRAHYDREQHGVERSGQAAVLAGEPEDPGPARDPLDAPSAGGWPTQPSCVVCGGRPAVPAVLREVTGMILRYRVDRLREALCADCGTATFRRMQARTLLRGWWGLLALFHNYSVVATNWVMARRFAALPPPQRPGSWPDGSPRPALEPGAPLWRRPTLLLGGLVLLALVGAAVVDLRLIPFHEQEDGHGALGRGGAGEAGREPSRDIPRGCPRPRPGFGPPDTLRLGAAAPIGALPGDG